MIEIMKESGLRLQEAYEKFDVLKATSSILGLRSSLEAAAALRQNVVNDKEIIEACNSYPEESKNRNKFLEEVTKWINDTISENMEMPEETSFSETHVLNFDSAKHAMVKMIEEEQSKELFKDTELPKLMEDIVDCKKHSDTICRVAENCKNGKFLALVLGDFQSGKSTTIDALCDGRHISAIGDGTATSAVLVMVSYGEAESLKIYWRTTDQFMPIFERIKRVLPEYDWASFDLEKRDERIKLVNAIECVRQKENKSEKQSLSQGDVKFLMLCDLILAFYYTKVLHEKKLSLLSLSNISDITRFPEDGEQKWKKEGVKNFTLDEAIFVFIDSVSCTTPSETLKKLNCTVIDSPGLFNSAYDTMVTESAMVAAHAIIYVLPYHKGIGQDVCASLYAIKERYADVHKKLFVVNNVDSLKENAFIDSNREFIKAEFGQEKELFVYNARVSYLTQLKRRYDMGLASASDFRHIMRAESKTLFGNEKLNFKTFSEAWDYWISPYKIVYGTSDISSTDIYLIKSGFADMVAALKAFIEKNEAYDVILSNALIPMRNELLVIRRELGKRFIEPYSKSHEELVSLWEKRIANAEIFQNAVSKIVHMQLYGVQNGASLCDRISKEEYNRIFSSDFYKEMAREIAYVLYDNKGQLLVTKTLFKKDKELFRQRFGDIAYPLISDKLTSMITCRMKYALEMIESGQDSIIDNMFVPITRVIRLQLEKEWNLLYENDSAFKMNDYLTVPENLKNCVVEKKSTASGTGTDIMSSGTISLTLLGGLVLQISAVVAGLAAMIAGYIGAIMCDPTGISQTTAIILFALLGIGGLIIESVATDWLRNKFANSLQEMVLGKLKEQGIIGFRNIVNSQLNAVLDRYADGRLVNISKMKNERDVALTPNENQEECCFRALEISNKISEQVSKYDAYRDEYIEG